MKPFFDTAKKIIEVQSGFVEVKKNRIIKNKNENYNTTK
jgi:hypothetical protein